MSLSPRKINAGRPSRQNSEALCDHLVTVADMVFREHGYATTSMAMVAARARIGKQTLYRRFADKGALFREVVRRRIDSAIPPRCAPAGRDSLAELKPLGHEVLKLVLDPEFAHLCRMVISEALTFPEIARAMCERFEAKFTERCGEAILRAQASEGCTPGAPETLARLFLWGLMGHTFLWGLSGLAEPMSEQDRDKHVEQSYGIFLNGVSIAVSSKA